MRTFFLLLALGCAPSLRPGAEAPSPDIEPPDVVAEPHAAPEEVQEARAPLRFEVLPTQALPPDRAAEGEVLGRAFPSHAALLRRMRARFETERRRMMAAERARSGSARSRDFSAVPSARQLAERFPSPEHASPPRALAPVSHSTVHDHFFVRLEANGPAGAEGPALKLVVRDIAADFAAVFEQGLPPNWQRSSPREDVQPSHQYRVQVSGAWVGLFGIRAVQVFRLDGSGQLSLVQRFDTSDLGSGGAFLPGTVLHSQFLAGDELILVSSRKLVHVLAERYQPSRHVRASLPTLVHVQGAEETPIPLVNGARVVGERGANRLLSISRCSLREPSCSTYALLLADDERGEVPFVRPSEDGLVIHARGSGDAYRFVWATGEFRRVSLPPCNQGWATNPCTQSRAREVTYRTPDGGLEQVELRGDLQNAWPIGDHLFTAVQADQALWLSTHHLGATMQPISEVRFDGVASSSLRAHSAGEHALLVQLTFMNNTSRQVLIRFDGLEILVEPDPPPIVAYTDTAWIVETEGELSTLPRSPR